MYNTLTTKISFPCLISTLLNKGVESIEIGRSSKNIESIILRYSAKAYVNENIFYNFEKQEISLSSGKVGNEIQNSIENLIFQNSTKKIPIIQSKESDLFSQKQYNKEKGLEDESWIE